MEGINEKSVLQIIQENFEKLFLRSRKQPCSFSRILKDR